jgi:hypothetical protein
VGGGTAPPFLISALDRGEWSGLRPCHFTSREIPPGTYCTGGCMDPRSGLETTEKLKTYLFAPARNQTPILRSSSSWPRIYNTKETIKTKLQGWVLIGFQKFILKHQQKKTKSRKAYDTMYGFCFVISVTSLAVWKGDDDYELHAEWVDSSPNIITRIMIKSRIMRWAGHIARMGEKRNAYRILVGKPE